MFGVFLAVVAAVVLARPLRPLRHGLGLRVVAGPGLPARRVLHRGRGVGSDEGEQEPLLKRTRFRAKTSVELELIGIRLHV